MPRSKSWKLNFKKKVAGATKIPSLGFTWINQVDDAISIDQLQNDGNFELLSARVAAGLSSIIHGDLLRQINVVEEQLTTRGRMINGRQVTWLLYRHFRVSEVQSSILGQDDLLNLSLRGDNVRAFLMGYCLIKHL